MQEAGPFVSFIVGLIIVVCCCIPIILSMGLSDLKYRERCKQEGIEPYKKK